MKRGEDAGPVSGRRRPGPDDAFSLLGRTNASRLGAGDVTVVLAEELTLVREGLAALCTLNPPYQVSGQCADGAAAVEMISSLKPHIAVLDLHLPKLFTLEAIRKLRDAGVATKLVVMSTRCDRKTVVEVLRGGANAFLLKSDPSRYLLDAFRQTMDGSIYVSPSIQLEKVLVSQRKGGAKDPLEKLSAREYQVFTLLIDGVRAKEIAARLDLSPKTVDTYRSNLMRKLDIHDVAGLVKFAITRNLTTAS